MNKQKQRNKEIQVQIMIFKLYLVLHWYSCIFYFSRTTISAIGPAHSRKCTDCCTYRFVTLHYIFYSATKGQQASNKLQ